MTRIVDGLTDQDEAVLAPDVSLANALAMARASGTFNERRLRDLEADARYVGRLLKQPLEMISLEPQVVRSYLSTIERAQGGKSSKRFKNIRSNLKLLAQLIGVHESRDLERCRFSAAWAALYQQIPAGFSRMGIIRFMRYCAWSNIAPGVVNDETVDAFEKHLRANTFTAEILRLVSRAARNWNDLADCVPGWPQQRLATRRDKSRRIARPLSNYPESFQCEFENYFAALAGADPFSPHRPTRPLAPATIVTRRQQLRRAADDLVESGRSPETITSLADLVGLEAFQTILTPRYDRKARRWPMSARQVAALLLDVAQHLHHQPKSPVTDEQLSELHRSFGTIKTSFPGMPAATRELLRQLDDPIVLHRFLEVPRRLTKAARNQHGHSLVRAAQVNEIGVLVDLAQRLPLRCRNLASLDLDRHFTWDSKGRLTGIDLDGVETKNGKSFSGPLPRSVCERIGHHVKVHRPQLPGAGESRFLFPSPGGRHRGGEALSRRFSAAVQDHAGLKMRLHDVRHIAAWLLLREDARNLPRVQQLLNHSSLRTTERYYGDLRQAAALRHYDELLTTQIPQPRKKLRRR